jgi:hypothetical protein
MWQMEQEKLIRGGNRSRNLNTAAFRKAGLDGFKPRPV